MTISMYQASAPRFANTLKNLSAILDKAQAPRRRDSGMRGETFGADPCMIWDPHYAPDSFAFEPLRSSRRHSRRLQETPL